MVGDDNLAKEIWGSRWVDYVFGGKWHKKRNYCTLGLRNVGRKNNEHGTQSGTCKLNSVGLSCYFVGVYGLNDL